MGLTGSTTLLSGLFEQFVPALVGYWLAHPHANEPTSGLFVLVFPHDHIELQDVCVAALENGGQIDGVECFGRTQGGLDQKAGEEERALLVVLTESLDLEISLIRQHQIPFIDEIRQCGAVGLIGFCSGADLQEAQFAVFIFVAGLQLAVGIGSAAAGAWQHGLEFRIDIPTRRVKDEHTSKRAQQCGIYAFGGGELPAERFAQAMVHELDGLRCEALMQAFPAELGLNGLHHGCQRRMLEAQLPYGHQNDELIGAEFALAADESALARQPIQRFF